MSNLQERLKAVRVALSSHLAAHVEYDLATPGTWLRTRLHAAAEDVRRASRSPTLFGVLDNLHAALGDVAESLRDLERPAPPTSIPHAAHGDRIDVRPTGDVSWSELLGTWICFYVTTDARVSSEFRTWCAVWVDGAWRPAEG